MEKGCLSPSVYLVASQNDKEAGELLRLLETIDSCIQYEPGKDNPVQPCNNDIAGLLNSTAEKLRQAMILANGIALKIGTGEIPKLQGECVPMQVRHAR